MALEQSSITGQRDSAWPCVNGDYEFSAKWQNFYTLPNLELSTDLLQFFVGDYVTEYTNSANFGFDQITRGVSTR
jgi:hypothetical protein